MPSVTKWNVVPPSIGSDSRGWWVSTKTAWWYGGLSPHQPVHLSSTHGPRIGPNMLRPMIVAPKPALPRAANSSSRPSTPPPAPNMVWKVRVATNQSCRRSPPTPSGLSSPWSGPAP